MIFICLLDKSQTFSFSIPQSCECSGSRGWKKSVIDAYSSKASQPASLPSLPAHTPAYQPVEQNRKGQKLRATTAEPNANVNELKLMHRFFYFARHAPQSAAGRGAASTAAAASNCIRLVQLHQLPRASSSTLPPPPYSQRRRALPHSANHPPPPLKYPLRSLLVYSSRSLHTAHCTPACTLHCFPKLSSFYTPQSTGALLE